MRRRTRGRRKDVRDVAMEDGPPPLLQRTARQTWARSTKRAKIALFPRSSQYDIMRRLSNLLGLRPGLRRQSSEEKVQPEESLSNRSQSLPTKLRLSALSGGISRQNQSFRQGGGAARTSNGALSKVEPVNDSKRKTASQKRRVQEDDIALRKQVAELRQMCDLRYGSDSFADRQWNAVLGWVRNEHTSASQIQAAFRGEITRRKFAAIDAERQGRKQQGESPSPHARSPRTPIATVYVEEVTVISEPSPVEAKPTVHQDIIELYERSLAPEPRAADASTADAGEQILDLGAIGMLLELSASRSASRSASQSVEQQPRSVEPPLRSVEQPVRPPVIKSPPPSDKSLRRQVMESQHRYLQALEQQAEDMDAADADYWT